MSLVSAANRDQYLENKRQQILKAALEVFKTKGYANTSITDIAKQADIGKGTLYLYFKNKEELLYSVFMECSMLPELANWPFDLEAPMEQVLRGFAEGVLKDVKDFVSLLLMSASDLSKLAKEHPDQSFHTTPIKICRNLEMYLEAKKTRKEISQAVNCKMLAWAFISMIQFPVIMQEIESGFFDLMEIEEYITEAVAIIVNRAKMDGH